MERHRVLQQAFNPTYVHNPHPDTVHDKLGESNRLLNHIMEHIRCCGRPSHVPTNCEELEFRTTWVVWKSTQVLLLDGCDQSHHGYCHHRFTDAVPFPIENAYAQKTGRYGAAQYWYRVGGRHSLWR
jgi:hypothetical protein